MNENVPVPTPSNALDVLVVCNPVWEVTARLGEPLSAHQAWKQGQTHVAETAIEAVWGTGGSASNTAAALARRGRIVAQVGSVGSDEAGELACSFLREQGVHLSVRVHPGRRTKSSAILLQPGGQTDFQIWAPSGTVEPASLEHIPSVWDAPKVLHLDRVPEWIHGWLDSEPVRPNRLSLDLHSCPYRRPTRERLERLLPHLAYLQLSNDAGALLEEDWFRDAIRAIPWVVWTRGADGLRVLIHGEGWRERPSLVRSSAVTDGTGAGDAFAAEMVEALLEDSLSDQALIEAVERGLRAAAAVCGRIGPHLVT